MAGFQVCFEGFDNSLNRMVATLFQSTIDAHQHCLGVGAAVGAVGVAGLTHDHGWTNRTLGMVVVERHPRMIEERQQIVLMAAQAFDQTTRVGVLPIGIDQFCQTLATYISCGCPPKGKGIYSFVPALNSSPGHWTVSVVEAVSGKQASTHFEVQ